MRRRQTRQSVDGREPGRVAAAFSELKSRDHVILTFAVSQTAIRQNQAVPCPDWPAEKTVCRNCL